MNRRSFFGIVAGVLVGGTGAQAQPRITPYCDWPFKGRSCGLPFKRTLKYPRHGVVLVGIA